MSPQSSRKLKAFLILAMLSVSEGRRVALKNIFSGSRATDSERTEATEGEASSLVEVNRKFNPLRELITRRSAPLGVAARGHKERPGQGELQKAFDAKTFFKTPAPPAEAGRRSPVVQMKARWDDPIFDESIPDPVFDRESAYMGSVPYGFSRNAELVNARTAMMGFVIAFLQEAFAGRGVLQQYGLPYDKGAVVPTMDGFVLPWPVALVLAVVVTVAATYGGATQLGKVVKDDNFKGTYELPFQEKLSGGTRSAPVEILPASSPEADWAKGGSANKAEEKPGLYGGAQPLRRPPQLAEWLAEPEPDADAADPDLPGSEAAFRKANNLPDAFEGKPRRPTPVSDGKWLAEMSDIEKAERNAKLDALSEKWKKREDNLAYQESIRSGFGPGPELINGRTAMFFIVVGLITEYYTGQSMPDQVYTLLQSIGIVE